MKVDIKRVKISVTVPDDDIAIIRGAVCKAGAGVIGDYDFCSNSCKVIGTFRPNEKANPYIGEKNKLEYVDGEKLEVVCDVKKVKNVISVLRKVHPYEEPAIDIIPLLDEDLFD
jgi:hypothetical protein